MRLLDYQAKHLPEAQKAREYLKTITQLPTASIDLLLSIKTNTLLPTAIIDLLLLHLANCQQHQFTNYCRKHHIDTLELLQL